MWNSGLRLDRLYIFSSFLSELTISLLYYKLHYAELHYVHLLHLSNNTLVFLAYSLLYTPICILSVDRPFIIFSYNASTDFYSWYFMSQLILLILLFPSFLISQLPLLLLLLASSSFLQFPCHYDQFHRFNYCEWFYTFNHCYIIRFTIMTNIIVSIITTNFIVFCRVWITIDNRLYLWNYLEPNECDVYEGLNEPILSVSLSAPKPGIFLDNIKYVLIVGKKWA